MGTDAVLAGKRPIKLTDVQVRPSFDGKRQSGDVEIHSNGIRYQSSLKTDQKIGASLFLLRSVGVFAKHHGALQTSCSAT